MRTLIIAWGFCVFGGMISCTKNDSTGAAQEKPIPMVDADGVCTENYVSLTKDFVARMDVIAKDKVLSDSDRTEKLYSKCQNYLGVAGGVKCTAINKETGARVSDLGDSASSLCKSVEKSWLQIHPTPEMIADKQQQEARRKYSNEIKDSLVKSQLCEYRTDYYGTKTEDISCVKYIANLDQVDPLLTILQKKDLDSSIQWAIRDVSESFRDDVGTLLSQYWREKTGYNTNYVKCVPYDCKIALSYLFSAIRATGDQIKTMAVTEIILDDVETKIPTAQSFTTNLYLNYRSTTAQMQTALAALPKIDSEELKASEIERLRFKQKVSNYLKRTKITVECASTMMISDCNTGIDNLIKSEAKAQDLTVYRGGLGMTIMTIVLSPKDTKTKNTYLTVPLDFSLTSTEMTKELRGKYWGT